MKIRLDKALVERGLAASRERATALVLAGRVLVSEQRVEKPGTPIDEHAPLRLLGGDLHRETQRAGLCNVSGGFHERPEREGIPGGRRAPGS